MSSSASFKVFSQRKMNIGVIRCEKMREKKTTNWTRMEIIYRICFLSVLSRRVCLLACSPRVQVLDCAVAAVGLTKFTPYFIGHGTSVANLGSSTVC